MNIQIQAPAVEANIEFKPCAGKGACSEGGTHCKGCGRSHSEIARTRFLLDSLTNLVIEQGYHNVEAFSDYISRHLNNMVNARRNGLI